MFDLRAKITYILFVIGVAPPLNLNKRGYIIMKLAVRILAISVVVVGVAAAATTSKTISVVPSHQVASAAFPVPIQAPGPLTGK